MSLDKWLFNPVLSLNMFFIKSEVSQYEIDAKKCVSARLSKIQKQIDTLVEDDKKLCIMAYNSRLIELIDGSEGLLKIYCSDLKKGFDSLYAVK